MQDGYSMTSSPPFAARAPEEVEWYMGRDANAELPDSLDELRAQFERDGFLVFPGFWGPDTVQEVREAFEQVVRGFDLEESKTIFSTHEQSRVSDEYFLSSGDKVRFFWEEDAFDEAGDFKQDRFLCINKVGHALHDLVPTFQKVTYTDRVGVLARRVGGQDVPLAAQSMYICKQPRIGGEVSPHQDGTFLYTAPQSVVGFWWALEDCERDNGCLWAVPGSHKQGVSRRFKRKPAPAVGTVMDPPTAAPFDLEGAVPLEVKAGTLVMLHHALVHYSSPNRSDKSRHAFSVHVIDGRPGCVYPADNWLQRPPENPFRELP